MRLLSAPLLLLLSTACAASAGSPRSVGGGEAMPPASREVLDDGSDCGPCAAPGVCREGLCIQPAPGGADCEFDEVCQDGELCIAASCTPDPRLSGSCMETADCPIGFLCDGNACTPQPDAGCVADAECGVGMVCSIGACISASDCGITHPSLTGTWNLQSELRFREALPSWLDSLLNTLEGPFLFLAGRTSELNLGLGVLDAVVEPVIRSWAESHLTQWQRDMFGALADLNQLLSTWAIDEEMVLTGQGPADVYEGTHRWRSVRFEYGGRTVVGRPEDIVDYRFEPDPFLGRAVCGQLLIERHDVDVSIGAIIAWAVDTLVTESSGRRYAGLEDALNQESAGFCDGAGSAAEGAASGSGALVRAACQSELGRLIQLAVQALRDARLDAGLLSLKGSAPIVSDRFLTPGRWEGSLVGSDFTGDFSATR